MLWDGCTSLWPGVNETKKINFLTDLIGFNRLSNFPDLDTIFQCLIEDRYLVITAWNVWKETNKSKSFYIEGEIVCVISNLCLLSCSRRQKSIAFFQHLTCKLISAQHQIRDPASHLYCYHKLKIWLYSPPAVAQCEPISIRRTCVIIPGTFLLQRSMMKWKDAAEKPAGVKEREILCLSSPLNSTPLLLLLLLHTLTLSRSLMNYALVRPRRSATSTWLHSDDSKGKRLLSVRLHPAEWGEGRERETVRERGRERVSERERERAFTTVSAPGSLVTHRTWRPRPLPKSFSRKTLCGLHYSAPTTFEKESSQVPLSSGLLLTVYLSSCNAAVQVRWSRKESPAQWVTSNQLKASHWGRIQEFKWLVKV